ncbi:16S rRNA (guanine(966)-N(2))-methyltransferase RsmD [Desulfitibacter alkalitolerans]|uniref:16S rRNA (guanine(966)-N(2))-methyltransferase RsmD n=1 Tax=Desulfitibacter alkalitolerans TaxID=264641 RepID=UPI0004827C4F|nr:16S rRNA (guanine(966)-N(2))-methyltransferase RsmD [Desulfitibacter alkalitolerans]
MRIISGYAKGRRIIAPRGTKIRPTSDRVKEAIFNTISPLVYKSDFLDLFAGTGNIGIEALSRGANSCTFVDQSPKAIKCIRNNLANIGFEDRSTIILGDSRKIINKLTKIYDIIFLDPPYGYDLVVPIVKKLKLLLKEEGIIVVETESKIELPPQCDTFRLLKTSKYGDTQVGYYK